MKKVVLFLAFLLIVPFGGCSNNDDLKDTITRGTWRVGYYTDNNDDETWRFNGYVFTFLADGTITVARPGQPVAPGTWNEFNYDTRLDLDFGNAGTLERLNETWAVVQIHDDELLMNKEFDLTTKLRFDKL